MASGNKVGQRCFRGRARDIVDEMDILDFWQGKGEKRWWGKTEWGKNVNIFKKQARRVTKLDTKKTADFC